MVDHSAILRTAHARAKREMAHDAGHTARGRRWASYRAAFAYALRLAWGAAKELARQALADAALSALEEAEADAAIAATPRNIAARVGALRSFAATMPTHDAGREQRRSLMAEADDLAMAARLSFIPALESTHHAR